MSIASEISRIAQNVSDSFDAVVAKGVVVPSGSNSDDLPDLISQIQPNLQAKSNISPTESNQTITADNAYDGLSSVQINAISSSYIGSNIARRSSSDLTINSGTVTAPAGYYASNASATVSFITYYTGTSAPSSSLGSDGDIYLQTGG